MSQPKTLLVSHFYNEEFLLPFWIKQHIDMFDDVVMIDYNSTDSSVDIIKQLAPHWQIRTTRNEYFDPGPIDEEVMDIEREFAGYWKMCLNTTEFILMPELNLKKFIAGVEEKNPDTVCISSTGVLMVDSPEHVDKPVDPNVPLYAQRQYGSIENGNNRCRILHKMPDGQYTTGRHNSRLERVYPKDVFYCMWYGWSPYCDALRKRKMQIQSKLHPMDSRKDVADSSGHFIQSIEVLNQRFVEKQLSGCYDLLTNVGFNAVVQTCPKSF